MNIGGRSNNTILDIVTTGLRNVIRELGMPSEAVYKTRDCKITAKSDDLSKRVKEMIVEFNTRENITQPELDQALKETKIGCRATLNEGRAHITVPPFEWRQLAQLAPLDTVVERFVVETLRSKTWAVEVGKFIKSNFNINSLVEEMEERGASDLHLRAGNKPFIRIDNDLVALDKSIISSEDMKEIVLTLGGQEEIDILETNKESSFQYHAAGIGYFRCSAYIKTDSMALAIRLIPEDPPSLANLSLPKIVEDVCSAHRGLFLVCGVTGSGKSTTLAAMVEHINKSRKRHIITIEDPIEFVYKDSQSIISQRMVGRDTHSFANALRGALREDPDVILVGEMRDLDTIRAGLSAAETGHLVFSTLHTNSAVDTVNRVISYFSQAERDLIRQELAYTLQGVICQRLLKKIGGGRVPCVEVLLGGIPMVRDAIIDGDLEKIHGIIENDSIMQSFDQHAVEMYENKVVTKEEAISACRDEEGFERVMSGIKSSSGKLLK